MTFLAPLFLLGALAVLGPILFHLIRRTTREVTPFSTLMFLLPSPPRITKRSRLENLLLLLLRCTAIALLAVAFGRPLLRESSRSPLPPSRDGKQTVLLVDASASMRRGELWESARKAVEARLAGTTAGDDVAIVLFENKPREVLSFEEWRKTPVEQRAALARQRLGEMRPGFGGTRLDAALIRSAELLDQPDSSGQAAQREIVLISDLQEGAKLDALQGFAWPHRVAVTVSDLRPADRTNAGIAWLPDAENGAVPTAAEGFRLRVTNSAESKQDHFALKWMGGTGSSAEFSAYVPAGKARIIRAPKAPAGADRVVLTGDAADFDNTAFVLPPHARQVPLLFVGTAAEDDPAGLLYYVRRAFPRTAKQEVQITAHRSSDRIPDFQLQQTQLLIVGDGATEAALAGAGEFVRGGKIALVPIGTAAMAQVAAAMLGSGALPAREATVGDYAMLADIDFQHPLFAPFADPRFSDFTKIHFWRYRRLDVTALPQARVLAKFDSGDPAIVQVPVGKGSVVLLATTWKPVDSQLALSSKFVPLLQSLLDESSQLPPTQAQYVVGDEVALPPAPAALTIRKPDGSEVAVAAGSRFTAGEPGIYHVLPSGARFVVNLSPEESRTSPFTAERLATLGVPLAREGVNAAKDGKHDSRTQAIELEQQQKLWRWAILACLGLLLVETLVAARLSRASRMQTDPA